MEIRAKKVRVDFKREYLKFLGSRLREARKLAELSQKEVCIKLKKSPFQLKYTQQMISRFECGKSEIPHFYVEAIASLTSRHPSYFYSSQKLNIQ